MRPIEQRVAPMLVCLNLQTPYIDPSDRKYAPRAMNVLANAQACLAWARGQNMRILHVHSESVEGGAPIPSFEPRPDEPLIFKRSWSVFDCAEALRARPPLKDAFVLGFAGARDCLATAIDAERWGVRLVFITDAIASPALSGCAPEIVDDVLGAVLGEWALRITTADLLRRDARIARHERGLL